MATFEIETTEGMRWVKVGLDDDDMRAERGALNHFKGAISMDVPLPSLRGWWVSLFSDESVMRPRYRGTGTVYLDSTLGGFHVLQVAPGERWILDTKCFWASDGEVKLAIHRERVWTAYWADQGLLWYKTALHGDGQAVLSVAGPVEEVDLVNDQMIVDPVDVEVDDSDLMSGPGASGGKKRGAECRPSGVFEEWWRDQ
jgi:uncharacterized protein (AIM24 family)